MLRKERTYHVSRHPPNWPCRDASHPSCEGVSTGRPALKSRALGGARKPAQLGRWLEWRGTQRGGPITLRR